MRELGFVFEECVGPERTVVEGAGTITDEDEAVGGGAVRPEGRVWKDVFAVVANVGGHVVGTCGGHLVSSGGGGGDFL